MLAQLGTTYSVTLPDNVKELLAAFDWIQFDVTQFVVPVGCVVGQKQDRVLLAGVFPWCVFLALVALQTLFWLGYRKLIAFESHRSMRSIVAMGLNRGAGLGLLMTFICVRDGTHTHPNAATQ